MAKPVPDFKEGDLIWWTYHQDYPVAKSWDSPCKVLSRSESGEFEVFDYGRLSRASSSVQHLAGTIRMTTASEVRLYLRRQANALDTKLAERELETEQMRQKVERLRALAQEFTEQPSGA